jgi:hypothetical protein
MAYDGTPGAGSLYRTDPGGTVVRVLDGLTIHGVKNPAAASGAVLSVPVPAGGTAARSWRVRH